MGSNNKKNVVLTLSMVLCVPGVASANSEAPAMYDARNNGMGGASIAHLDSPAAVMHNPANLAATRGSQQQFDITALVVKLTGSFAGPDNVEDSPWIVAPLPFMGYQKRVSDDLTMGWAVYMSTGFGGGYEDVKQYGTGRTCTDSLDDVFIVTPGGGVVLNNDAQYNDYCPPYGRDETVQLALFELAFPFSYEIRDDLRVGLSIRFPFGMFTQTTSEDIVGAFVPPEQAAGSYGLGYAQVESEMYGVGTPGFMAGVTYDVTSYFSVAATYRSKVTTTMKGDTQLFLKSNLLVGQALGALGNVPIGTLAETLNAIPDIGPLLAAQLDDTIGSFADRIASDIDSEIDWSTAKEIELGFALRVTPGLLFAVDWRHLYLEEANKEFVVQLKEPLFIQTGLNQLGQTLNWKDVYGWSFGLEYSLDDHQWLRFGHNFGNSATPPEYANAFTPPPADKQGSYSVGYGIRAGKWQYDVGFNYAKVEYEIAQPYDADGQPVDTPTCRPGQLVKSGCPGRMGVETYFLALSANYILP
ncbi:MAG: hypothetical protein HPY82_05195 [Gammaproteobacteria bacterium]|nr:hypothetical protein [Gammaproteobacteria bacterium]